jgi:hypothetical protein
MTKNAGPFSLAGRVKMKVIIINGLSLFNPSPQPSPSRERELGQPAVQETHERKKVVLVSGDDGMGEAD